jgi:hypothetical protein
VVQARRGIEMEADSIDVSVSATSKRKKKTLTHGPAVAVTQGEREKGEAACGFGWAGPIRDARTREGSWAAGLRG